MLLRFTVENSLCFGDEAVFSMTATPDDRHPTHVIASTRRSRPSALRAAAIYGANGHGKSNFVESLAALRRIVSGGPLRIPVFKLDPNLASEPTRLIIEFRHENADYEYGLVLDQNFIHEEWLFATFERGRERLLFKRACKDLGDKYSDDIELGTFVKNEQSPSKKVKMIDYLDVIHSSIGADEPFLREAARKKVRSFLAPFNWITKILVPVRANASYSHLHDRVESDANFLTVLQKFMCAADVGIRDIQLKTTPLEEGAISDLPESILQQLEEMDDKKYMDVGSDDGRNFIIERNEEGKLVKRELVSSRSAIDGSLILFESAEESSGTRRLVELVPLIADPDDERVYVVDELDRKLHPLLAYELIQAFLSRGCGQLIFTTHNTYLMTLDLLRRDEIFFVQKKMNGSSEIYSLADLKVRPDLDVRKGYLHGRFGAIPFLGNIDDLGWSGEA